MKVEDIFLFYFILFYFLIWKVLLQRNISLANLCVNTGLRLDEEWHPSYWGSATSTSELLERSTNKNQNSTAYFPYQFFFSFFQFSIKEFSRSYTRKNIIITFMNIAVSRERLRAYIPPLQCYFRPSLVTFKVHLSLIVCTKKMLS